MALSSSILGLVSAYWPYALPFLLFLYFFSNWYQKGLHRVPGPWINSISTLPRIWSVYCGQHHLDDLRMHAKYGKVVRVAPNLVSVTDTNEINQLYGITTKFIKSPFYDLAATYDDEGFVPDPFVIRKDKALHSRMKRNAANAYSLNGLIQFEPWVDPILTNLVHKLDEYAYENRTCDIGDLLKNFAMDAVCNLTFGSDFGYINKGDELGFFNTMDLVNNYMSLVSYPYCTTFLTLS